MGFPARSATFGPIFSSYCPKAVWGRKRIRKRLSVTGETEQGLTAAPPGTVICTSSTPKLAASTASLKITSIRSIVPATSPSGTWWRTTSGVVSKPSRAT